MHGAPDIATRDGVRGGREEDDCVATHPSRKLLQIREACRLVGFLVDGFGHAQIIEGFFRRRLEDFNRGIQRFFHAPGLFVHFWAMIGAKRVAANHHDKSKCQEDYVLHGAGAYVRSWKGKNVVGAYESFIFAWWSMTAISPALQRVALADVEQHG